MAAANLSSLAIVTSPLQLLCAIEYFMVSDCLRKAKFIFKVGLGTRAHSQMELLLNDFGLRCDVLVSLREMGSLPEKIESYARVIRSLQECSYQYVLLGDVRQQWMQDLVCNLSSEQVIMIDDGAAVLSVHKHVLSKNGCVLPFNLFPKSTEVRKKEVLSIKHRLGLVSKQVELGIFSMFNIASPHYFRRHRFENVREMFNGKSVLSSQGEWHFIGMHLVEEKLMSEDEYWGYLSNVVNRMPSKSKMVYIPHRFENLDEKRKKLTDLSVEIRELDYPYEINLLHSSILPDAVIGFYTTCLFSVSALYSDNIEIFYIRIKDETMDTYKAMTRMHQQFSFYEHVVTIYDLLETMDVKQIFTVN